MSKITISIERDVALGIGKPYRPYTQTKETGGRRGMAPRQSKDEHGMQILTSDTRDGFTTGQISDVDESVVETGVDTGNTENLLAVTGVGAELDVFLGSNFLSFGGLQRLISTGGMDTMT
jgi:hypothetical protein